MLASPNVLAAALTSPELYRAEMLRYRLHSSGSTWEIYNPNLPGTPHASDTHHVVRALAGNDAYLSVSDMGCTELLIAAWVCRRMKLGCPPQHAMSLLSGEQAHAVNVLLREPIACLTGLPGTGKTYVLKVVYETMIRNALIVKLCAFTGSAASRLGESVGGKGSTIHRLLGYRNQLQDSISDNQIGSFYYNEKNKLDIDCIIVDEAGMLPPNLLKSLLYALPDDCIVLLIGDPRQLPSVEPGQVLADLCQVVPHVQLTQVRRTEPDGPIGMAALSMLKGEIPANAERGDNGFVQIPYVDEELTEKAWRVQCRMARKHECGVTRIRSMAPTNLAVDNYNKHCQKKYEGPLPYIARKNRALCGYFNGDRGYQSGDEIHFENGHRAILRKSDFDLGFCSTIHRMQGHEADCILILIPKKGGGHGRWSEYFTAITRGRLRVVLIGNLETFARACRSQHASRRITLLKEFITGKAKML